jgi:hypothetical protein
MDLTRTAIFKISMSNVIGKRNTLFTESMMTVPRLFLALALIGVIGCGSGGPFKYTKVRGRVTYEDGSPIPTKGLRLRFAALEAPKVEKAFPRPAFAEVDQNGEFESVTSYKPGDGLIPGKHKVAIEAGGGPDANLPVPKEYSSISTTPLIIDTAQLPLEIKIPKPKGKG